MMLPRCISLRRIRLPSRAQARRAPPGRLDGETVLTVAREHLLSDWHHMRPAEMLRLRMTCTELLRAQSTDAWLHFLLYTRQAGPILLYRQPSTRELFILFR